MKKIAALFLLLISSFLLITVKAQEQNTPLDLAQKAVETRQSVFKLLDMHMEPLAAMARGRVPFDATLAVKNSKRISQLAAMIPDVFAMDTREFEVETLALDKIWDNKSDFEKHALELIEKADAFSTAAQGGDQAANMKEIRPLGTACGNCHDNYRMEKK